MATNDYDIIFTRRHPFLEEREDIYELIYNSYQGGHTYIDPANRYLIQNKKESDGSYKARYARAVYLNQIRSLVELLVGILYTKPPTRNVGTDLKWFFDQADDKKRTFDQFMSTVATYSALFTCGVLVDAPEEVPENERDRLDRSLYPYCVLYLPFDIIDFNFTQEGTLDWIILRNDYYDNSDYLSEGVMVEKRTLWTPEYHQSFEKNPTDRNITVGAVTYHNLGFVPFRFVNWKDDDPQVINESVFEDPALISKSIFNDMSLLDEMIGSGSFKVLMYPSTDGDVPSSLKLGGIGSLSIIPYKGEYKPPQFDGARLEDVEPYIKLIEFKISEILKCVGMDTDETKDYVKSGLSKKIDFKKTQALLKAGALSLGELEEWIFRTLRSWEINTINEEAPEVHYITHYDDEDTATKVALFYQLLLLPFEKLRTTATKLIAQHTLTGEVPNTEIEEVIEEIIKGKTKKDLTVSNLDAVRKENETNE